MNITLADFLDKTNGINCIQFYFTVNGSPGCKNIFFKNQYFIKPTINNSKTYHHRNLVYKYDLENDGQRVTRQSFIKDYTDKNIYIIGHTIDILPTHKFPCTDDIVHTVDIESHIYRINNRMFIYLEKENDGISYLYIKYNHAENIDLSKMQYDLTRTIQWIQRNVSMEPI